MSDPVVDPARYLAQFGLAEGTSVLVAGERGTYRIRGVSKDGSLTCFGTNTGARSFRPEWCTPVSRDGRDGKQVTVRKVPQSAKEARAAWRQEHGLAAIHDHDHDVPVTAPGLTL